MKKQQLCGKLAKTDIRCWVRTLRFEDLSTCVVEEIRTCFAPIGIYRPVTELTPRLERRVSSNYIVVALQGNFRKLANNYLAHNFKIQKHFG